MNFVEDITKYVLKYAPQYGICVYSPIIAQALYESNNGTSILAIECNNFFNLKFRGNRCKRALPDPYENNIYNSENENDKYWYKFLSTEDGVVGYFEYTNIPNYNNLKGITEPRLYLEILKKDHYNNDPNYVENIMKVIEDNNLTKYDPEVPVEGEYIYNFTDYSPVFDPIYYANRYEEIKKKYNYDDKLLFQHFTLYGMDEALQGNKSFNPIEYKERHPELARDFGNNWKAYYTHYCLFDKH